MRYKKLIKKLDFFLLSIVMLLIIYGFILIYSATYKENSSELFIKQIIWFFIGLFFMFLIISFDYNILERWYKPIYGINIFLLILVLIIGKTTYGAQRWISLGPFPFQPSEFAKLAIIITLSSFFAIRQKIINRLDTLVLSLLHIAVPLFLVFKQPDLGTSFAFLAIWLGMAFVAGLKFRYIIGLIMVGVASFPFLWHHLEDYQKRRLLIFLDPNVDPLGAGYHIIQTKIAIGSGKLWGKGLLSGTQSQLNFIPGQHTDFIFSIAGEELGFIGCFLLILLFLILLLRSLQIAHLSKDMQGTFLISGVVSMWAFHIIVNIGMTLGIMPITGIPLPFLSYGGSSLLTNMMAVALILNVGIHRQKIRF